MCVVPSFVAVLLFCLNMKSFLHDLMLAARLVDDYFTAYTPHAVKYLGLDEIILRLGSPFVNYDFVDAETAANLPLPAFEHTCRLGACRQRFPPFHNASIVTL